MLSYNNDDADLRSQGMSSGKDLGQQIQLTLVSLPHEVLSMIIAEADWDDVLRLRGVGSPRNDRNRC